METPTNGVGQNWLPAFSPDGTRIAFTSNRDGNSEIYVMNRDGSNVRRLTNNPAIDSTPTWSPTGTQIAFTSDRTGPPQIYVDRRRRPRPAADLQSSRTRPPDLVAGAVQRDRVRRADRAGLRHQDPIMATGRRGRSRLAKAPTRARRGRRTAGTWRSCRRARAERSQIFTVDRDGKNLRQITSDGNNSTPELVAVDTPTRGTDRSYEDESHARRH